MKKYVAFALIAGMGFYLSCSSLPPPKELKKDVDYFHEAMGHFNSKNYFDSIPAFEKVREKFPLSPYAVLSELRLGDSHYGKDEYVEASHYFENFRRLHPSNQHVPYSLFMAGICAYKQILSHENDQAFSRVALEHFQLLVDIFPTSPYSGKALCKISEAKQRIAENEFFVGSFYLRKQNYKGAIDRFRKVLQEYPTAIKKDKLLYYIADATIQSGNKEKGLRILKLLLARYPDSDYSPEATVLIDLHSSADG